jgi:hypothetical protein
MAGPRAVGPPQCVADLGDGARLVAHRVQDDQRGDRQRRVHLLQLGRVVGDAARLHGVPHPPQPERCLRTPGSKAGLEKQADWQLSDTASTSVGGVPATKQSSDPRTARRTSSTSATRLAAFVLSFTHEKGCLLAAAPNWKANVLLHTRAKAAYLSTVEPTLEGGGGFLKYWQGT